jgi:hypothetical protein
MAQEVNAETKEKHIHHMQGLINLFGILIEYSKDHPSTRKHLPIIVHLIEIEAKAIIDMLTKQIAEALGE